MRKFLSFISFLVLVFAGFLPAQAPYYFWVDEARSLGADRALQVSVDTSGNVYSCGSFGSALTPGDLTGADYTAGLEGYFARHQPNGTLSWAVSINGASDQEVFDVAVGPDQSVYVCGYFEGTADFTGTSGAPVVNATAFGFSDLFVAKYDPAGDLVWMQRAQNSFRANHANSIYVDGSGVYITGSFMDSLTLGTVVIPTSDNTNRDAFVAKLDATTGNPLWGRAILRSGGAVDGVSITGDGSQVYAVGRFETADVVFQISPLVTGSNSSVFGTSDIFLCAYSTAGNLNWSTTLGSTGEEIPGGLTANSSGVFLTGAGANGSGGFNAPGLGSAMSPVPNGQDAFLMQFDRVVGLANWGKFFPDGTPLTSIGSGLDADENGNVVVSGSFANFIDLGGQILNSTGQNDAFLASFSNVGVLNWALSGESPQSTGFSGVCAVPNDTICVAGFFDSSLSLGNLTSTGPANLNGMVARLIPEVVANPDSICLDEDVVTVLDVQINDLGNPLTTTILTGPTRGSAVLLNNDSIQYAPQTNYFGSDSIQYQICNGSGSCDTTWVILCITPVADPPTALPDTACTNAATSVTVSVTTNDQNPDGGPLTVGISTGATNGVASVSGTDLQYLPNPGFSGLDSVLYSITDTSGNSSNAWTYIFVNDLPNAGPDQAICQNFTNLTAAVPAGGATGIWSQPAGGIATIATNSSPNTAVTGLANGNNTFVWTLSLAGCSATDTIIVVQDTIIPSFAGPDTAFCDSVYLMQASNPAPGTGIWMNSSGAGTIISPTSQVSQINNLAGASAWNWIVTNGACKDTSTVSLQADGLVPAVAGPDQQVCGLTATLAAGVPASGSGSWSIFTGSGSISPLNDPAGTFTASGSGAHTLLWTVTNGSCVDSDAVLIESFTLINAISGTDTTFCGDSLSLYANNPSPGTGLWTQISGSGLLQNSSLANTPYFNIAQGTDSLVWTVTNGPCQSSDTLEVQVFSPVPAQAMPDSSLCSDSLQLFATFGGPGSGGWTVISGGGSLISPGTPTCPVSNLSSGNNRFYWEVTNGLCQDRDTVSITRDTIIPSFAGNDTSICGGQVPLSAQNPSPATGTWSHAGGTAIFSSPNSSTSQVSGLNTGNNLLIWEVMNGSCMDRDTQNITVSAPVVANAGSDSSFCGNFGVLNAQPPSPGTGQWTLASGAGSVVSPGNAATNVNGLGYGNNEFVWEVINGVCLSRDTVVLNAFVPVIANGGVDQSVCGDSATLNAVPDTVGSGFWSLFSGNGTITNGSDPQTSVHNLTLETTVTLLWTMTNGACMVEDTVRVSAFTPVTAFAGPDDSLCGTDYQLSATPPAFGSGYWIQGAYSFDDFNLPGATVSGLITGLNNLQWVVENGPCRDTGSVSLSVFQSVSLEAGADQSICGGDTRLAGSLMSPADSSRWSISAQLASIVNPDSQITNVLNLPAGSHTAYFYGWNGVCMNQDSLTITVWDSVFADAGPDTVICGPDYVMQAATPALGTGFWLNPGMSGTIQDNFDPNSPLSGLVQGSHIFGWRVENGACVDTALVQIDWISEPALAGQNFEVCQGDTVFLGADGTQSGNWTLLSPGLAEVLNTQNPGSGLVGQQPGLASLEWQFVNNGCDMRDTMQVEIFAPSSPANAGPDQSIPGPSTIMLGATPGVMDELTRWSQISGPATSFMDEFSPNSSVDLPVEGIYVFEWAVTNGVCPSSVDQVQILVTPLIVPDGFSPNEDGVNDAFVVKGLERLGRSKFFVYNRWGNRVFESQDYQNDWKGFSDSGEQLSDDTYYYILIPDEGEPFKGYVVLKR